MKIITSNFAYIQKEDLFNILFIGLSAPDSLLTKIFEKDSIMISDSNRYDFVKFENKNEINFFKKIDWIIDYADIKNLSSEDVAKLIEQTNNEMNNSTEESNKKYCDLETKKKVLKAKINSLKKILYLKNNNMFFNFPDDINDDEIDNSKRGIKKLIRKLIH